jgi:hypothetical protein
VLCWRACQTILYCVRRTTPSISNANCRRKDDSSTYRRGRPPTPTPVAIMAGNSCCCYTVIILLISVHHDIQSICYRTGTSRCYWPPLCINRSIDSVKQWTECLCCCMVQHVSFLLLLTRTGFLLDLAFRFERIRKTHLIINFL